MAAAFEFLEEIGRPVAGIFVGIVKLSARQEAVIIREGSVELCQVVIQGGSGKRIDDPSFAPGSGSLYLLERADEGDDADSPLAGRGEPIDFAVLDPPKDIENFAIVGKSDDALEAIRGEFRLPMRSAFDVKFLEFGFRRGVVFGDPWSAHGPAGAGGHVDAHVEAFCVGRGHV